MTVFGSRQVFDAMILLRFFFNICISCRHKAKKPKENLFFELNDICFLSPTVIRYTVGEVELPYTVGYSLLALTNTWGLQRISIC